MAVRDETVRVLQLIDHDEQFEFNMNQSGVNPVILNKFDLTNPDYIENISELVFSNGEGADFVARCACGEIEGDNKIGMVCTICGGEVSKANLLDDNNLVCRNWLSCPKELPGGWLSPKMYLNLSNWLTYDKSAKKNYLDDILDVDALLPYELREVVKGQGFGYFFENFDRIIDFFVNDHVLIAKKPDTAAMRFMIQLNRSKIFCHYIPILNSAINPIMSLDGGNSSKNKFSDITADHILKAATSLSRLEHTPKRKNRQRYVEVTTYKAFKDVIAYVEEATKKYISTKKAIPRQHLFGSRFHWSFRGVVIPIVGPHFYYELHVPWKMAVNTMRVQLTGILCRKHGMSINESTSRVRGALQRVDPLIKEILEQMIEESPFQGIPCLWDRPPSIRDGSVMLKFWTKIKYDLEDSCISMSPTDVALPNADFDGDNLAGVILHETDAVRAFRHLSPSSLIYDRNSGEVSTEIGLHKTTAVTWNAFLGNVSPVNYDVDA
jgi:hypothetical protein